MKRILLALGLITFANLILGSCAMDDLPRSSALGGLRVLALQSNLPEVGPGESVTVTPIVSYLSAPGGTTLSATVTHCLQPSLSVGGEATCDNNPTAVGPVTTTLSAPTSTDSLTGLADAFSVSAPVSGVIFAGRSNQDQYNGIAYLVIYQLSASDGQVAKAFKRISVTSRTGGQRNTNPVLTDLLANGASLSGLPIGTQVSLSAQTSSSPESFQVQLSDGNFSPRQEDFLMSWFFSDGEIQRDRSELSVSNIYTGPGAAPVGRKSFFIGILRDSRGGVSAVVKSF